MCMGSGNKTSRPARSHRKCTTKFRVEEISTELPKKKISENQRQWLGCIKDLSANCAISDNNSDNKSNNKNTKYNVKKDEQKRTLRRMMVERRKEVKWLAANNCKYNARYGKHGKEERKHIKNS